MGVTFCPIASGSNGNSIYIGTEDTHILIDAGISGKRIEEGLNSIGTTGGELDALFITHEHTDHIQGAGVISRKYDVPLYATAKTWDVMERCNLIGKINPKNKVVVYAEEKCVINDMVVRPFDIPHDAAQPVGYSVFAENHKVSVATDIGCVTDTIKENIYDSDVLLIESNHDIDMLKNGPYPYHLKMRILGNRGHLSNASTGQLLTEIMSEKLKYIFLGHLSEQNNRPLIAFDTVKSILGSKRIDTDRNVKLMLAHRGGVSEPINLV